MKKPEDIGILVISGDMLEAKNAAKELTELGFQNVSTAYSAYTARLFLKEHKPDIAIVDSRKAFMLLEGRADFPTTKILAVGEIEECSLALRKWGADGFHLVPSEPADMGIAILELCNMDTS